MLTVASEIEPVVDIDSPEWVDAPANTQAAEPPDRSTGPMETNTQEPATEPEPGERAAMEINMEQVPAPTPAEETPTSPAYIIIEREDLQDAGDDDIELLLKSGYAIGAGPKPYECSKANRMCGQII
ncbi:hypothetical protein R1sor_025966 [Riccia sorocarpa]|uniref:Uncharacterized protein n=1 Tax=Riccia sorocarpa TaxID=122646 RepID=A0ABD3GA33_9MARC